MGSLLSIFEEHLETLKFEIKEHASHGRYEIRRYPEYWVAKTKISKNGFSGSAFSSLAAYIGLFGSYKPANTEELKIPMTRPVFLYRQGEDKFMEFVLPENQHPMSRNGVVVQKVPAMLCAVVHDVNRTVANGKSWGMVEAEVAKIKRVLESQGYRTDPGSPWKIAIYSMPLFRQFPKGSHILVPVFQGHVSLPERTDMYSMACSRCGLTITDGS